MAKCLIPVDVVFCFWWHVSVSVCPETRERNFSLLIAWTWWGSEAKSCRNKPASTLCPLPSLIFFDNLLFLMSFCSNSLAILLKFDLKFHLHFLKEGSCVLKANWKTNPVGSLVEYICQWWDIITENKTNRNPKPTLGTVLEGVQAKSELVAERAFNFLMCFVRPAVWFQHWMLVMERGLIEVNVPPSCLALGPHHSLLSRVWLPKASEILPGIIPGTGSIHLWTGQGSPALMTLLF